MTLLISDIEIGTEIEIIVDEGTFKGTVCGINQDSIWVQGVELIDDHFSIIQSKNAVIFYCHEIKNLKIKEGSPLALNYI